MATTQQTKENKQHKTETTMYKFKLNKLKATIDAEAREIGNNEEYIEMMRELSDWTAYKAELVEFEINEYDGKD